MTSKMCDCNQGRFPCTCQPDADVTAVIAEDAAERAPKPLRMAEPVPPAGGDVEVLRYMFDWAGAMCSDGPRNWRVEVERELPHPDFFKDGQAKNLIELIDRAHFTRLQAELARMTNLHEAIQLQRDHHRKQRDALQQLMNDRDQKLAALEAENYALADQVKGLQELMPKSKPATWPQPAPFPEVFAGFRVMRSDLLPDDMMMVGNKLFKILSAPVDDGKARDV